MIRILLQMEDTYFVKAFSNYVSCNCPELEFLCFTSAEKANAFLKDDARRLDVIVGEERFLAGCGKDDVIRLVVSDHTIFSSPEAMRLNVYQAGRDIVADIKSALSLRKGYLCTTSGRSIHNVVALFSQQGGSGKTTIAYALALTAVRQGKQALYLNFEAAPYVGQLYIHDFQHSMDDLLFALKDGRELAPVMLDTLERDEEGVLILPPVHSTGDLLSLTQEEVRKILHVLIENVEIDYLLIDLPCGLYPLNVWVLEECTTILQVYTDDECGHARMRQAKMDPYYQELSIKGMTLTVMNRSRSKTIESGDVVSIPFSESLQQGRMVSRVQESNPAFLNSCTTLLQKLR